MNIRDTAELLLYVAAFDERSFDELTITAWNDVLIDIPLDHAKLCVRSHYAKPAAPKIKVGDIRGEIEAEYQKQRRDAFLAERDLIRHRLENDLDPETGVPRT